MFHRLKSPMHCNCGQESNSLSTEADVSGIVDDGSGGFAGSSFSVEAVSLSCCCSLAAGDDDASVRMKRRSLGIGFVDSTSFRQSSSRSESGFRSYIVSER